MKQLKFPLRPHSDPFVPSREHIIAAGDSIRTESEPDEAVQEDLEDIVHESAAPWGILMGENSDSLEKGMLLNLATRKLPRPQHR